MEAGNFIDTRPLKLFFALNVRNWSFPVEMNVNGVYDMKIYRLAGKEISREIKKKNYIFL